MPRFDNEPKDDYPILHLADTDKPLPDRVDPRTRYAYFKTIARGGRSIIQSCKDLHLMRTVCHKSLKPEFADDAAEQRRFLREARVSAMLQHPNTVPTYELGRSVRGHYYFTMKLVHGYTLREVFGFRERYDLPALVDVVAQVAQALDYAHSHGVAHRDIKPDNVLVGPFGEVLVMDWGLAKVWHPDAAAANAAAGGGSTEAPRPTSRHRGPGTPPAPVAAAPSLTAHGKLQGTVSYMSPEQIEGREDLDHRTDIYSLGAVLYEALAGRPPVAGDSVDEILRQTLDGEILPPSEFGAVPKRLADICMSCLRAEPDERIGTATELIRELRETW